MWAMPQSSRMMLTLAACCCQREMSSFVWAEQSVAVTIRMKPRTSFRMSTSENLRLYRELRARRLGHEFQVRLVVGQPGVQRDESAVALRFVTLGAIADPGLQRREQVEGDIRGLEVLALGCGDVVHQ